ncbi:MAG: enoyl-CoA hydratase/isomerase family protein, partial [Dokdonella sp.]
MSASYKLHGNVAVITMDNPPVNGLGFATRRGLAKGIERAHANKRIKAIVITGAGKAFSGGADIKEFGSHKAMAEPNLLSLIKMLDDASKPVIAAINGTCMGGGLELALGCHYRVAAPKVAIALPEVKLGLLPGAGGTQRLPRVLGVETALNMIVSGEPVMSDRLAALPGQQLFDKIIEGDDFMAGAIAFAKDVAEARPLKRVRDMKLAHPNAEAYLQFARNTVKAMA